MKKILLVEDDPGLGEVLHDQLKLNEYEVSLLRFPSKIIQNLEEDEFDLVIMDKLLSGIDGTQICGKIRNTESISEIPILMMSGYDGAKENCLAAGANSFIAKPFGLDDFLQTVKETIDQQRKFQN